MDFLQQFIEIAFGRMLGGGTTAQTDSSVGGGSSGWMSAAKDVPLILQTTTNPDRSLSKREQAQQAKLAIAQGVGDYFTGGAVSTARGFAESHWPGFMKRLEHYDRQIDPSLKWLGGLFPGKSDENSKNT